MIWRLLYYYTIGTIFASAMRHSDIVILLFAIIGLLIGVMWLFPAFPSEENIDR